MQQQYQISGLTCGNCKATVEAAINTIEKVNAVAVDLNTATVKIEMVEDLSIDEVQAVLPKKYELHLPVHKQNASKIKLKLQQLKPLLLILAYIFAAAVLINFNAFKWPAFMLDFMGIFYVVFSFFKFLDYNGFPEAFRRYDPLAKQFSWYAFLYPFIETVLGLMFLFRFQLTIALGLTIFILGITTFGVLQTLRNKNKIQCACLGTALKLPMTEATLIENGIMLLMAVTMITTYI